MGNLQSYQKSQEHSRFHKTYYSPLQHTMMIYEPLPFKSIIQTWVQKQQLYKHIYNIPQVFICYQYKIQSTFCSQNGMFIGKFYTNSKKTLQDEILRRNLTKQYYKQQEIWFLLLTLTKCAAHIYQYGQNHCIGNIHPYNILLKQYKNYQIIITNHSFSYPNQLDNFSQYKLNNVEGKNSFISPELLGFLSSKRYVDYPQYPKCVNKKKSQSFCLGLTMLSMATITLSMSNIFNNINHNTSHKTARNHNKTKITISHSHSNSITSIKQRQIQLDDIDYNIKINNIQPDNNHKRSHSHFDNIINFKYLNYLLSLVKERYSHILYDVIKGLLHPQPQLRTSVNNIYQELLKSVEGYISNFDKKWIYSADKYLSYQIPSLPQESQEICSNWLIRQSRTIFQRQDSKIQ